MSLKTFVKISNVSNLSDARYCAGMMVDVIGFNIDPTSDNFVGEKDFQEITEWVAGVSFAGEFRTASIEDIKEALRKYPVDLIEINQIDMVEEVQLFGKPILFRLEIVEEKDISQIKSTLSYLDELVKMVLIKCDQSELYDELDAQIGYYNGNLRLVKGYGISNHGHLDKFPGLELEATDEDRPGYKDYGQVMDILELIEED